MSNNCNGNNDALGRLDTPARNNYFYGKLMDVCHFEMEQRYFNRKRWLLNRLGLGYGVLCGLNVKVCGEDSSKIVIEPGVAIDPLGREIIVPAPYYLENPRQPTDDCGRPVGDPIEGEGCVTICLAYQECLTEMVPIQVGDCDTREDCAPSTICERFRLLVRKGVPENEPGQLSAEHCQAIFPTEETDDFSHRIAACETLSGPCPESDSDCVVLATVTLPADAEGTPVLDTCTYRSNIYSNSLLWELLTCLANREGECCRAPILRYVSGDAQQAAPEQPLGEPLVVKVIDSDGNPVEEEIVTFQIRAGGGTAAPESVSSDMNGRAQTQITLGPTVGLQTLEASISSGSHVLFLATAIAEEPIEPELECIEFEETPLDTEIAVDDSFVEVGVTIWGRIFFFINGNSTERGFARIDDQGNAGGSGQDILLNNINLDFDFGAPLSGLKLRFGHFGGNLNLTINGTRRNFRSFSSIDGENIGGVDASVAFDSPGSNTFGILTLTGRIESFVIGGQELWIDDICPAEE